mmetsp:Transcript_14068/g.19163  ORF Transcript_14068/g.19163 Transcript_14068/m.19163 type:complete len:100 (+) Transcript_14068:1336-1635(+)|eukprot:CAMPEP_0185613934 /NCGR_PEP_ID=MMETSP0436-20130131/29392_1 /TAXON_ID=626734 ORGANISM="Favella taraikaensis, Strain Fe Narragansett Bay" /NCGR_SAMPLE_ID=MMETSP0436 /ASSEMBLY_ACC=CAM_ASM_000390 /LENGTH=99 /DNA_ID=CAMNT_0028248311 /DNA_START=874 /DNA_END=1173 /DNA_ORIENTATION=+
MKTGVGMTVYSDANTCYEDETADYPNDNILRTNKTLLSDHEHELSSQASAPNHNHMTRPGTADAPNRIRKIATDSVFKKWGFRDPKHIMGELNITSTSF